MTDPVSIEEFKAKSSEDRRAYLVVTLADTVRRFGYTDVLAALAAVAEKETTRVLEEERDRVKAGRLASIRRDLTVMVTVLKGEI